MEQLELTVPDVTERFRLDGGSGEIVREVRRANGVIAESRIPHLGHLSTDLSAAYDFNWLTVNAEPEGGPTLAAPIRCVDLFCGLGGMSLGLREACRALGERLEVVMAADSNQVAAEVYRAFHPGTEVETQPIETWLDGELGAKPTKQEQALKERLGDVTIVMGGPPCQGHSNLNNHTRRQDPKNELYARMARFAEVVGPDHVIIENVPEVNRDRGGVMDLTCEALRENGYVVHSARLKAENFGVAQQRHRMFVVASRTGPLCHAPLEALLSRHQVTQPRSVLWAINDLVDSSHGSGFDACSVPQPLTQRRIEWYFQAENEDKYELPKEHRPACHLEHLSYGAVYGRMRPDQPAPTITTGFMTMGQGRFVHPSRPRTLTPHEGARVQFLPDWLGFPDDLFRKDYRLLIGNAVPPKLTYAVGVQLLG